MSSLVRSASVAAAVFACYLANTVALSAGGEVSRASAEPSSTASSPRNPAPPARPAAEKIRVPMAAGSPYAAKQPVLYMQIEAIDQTKDPTLKLSPGSLEAARRRLEAQLPRMKRFSVYTVFNKGAVTTVRELNDLGEVADVDASALPAPDLYLNTTITFNVEKGKLDGKQQKDSKYSMTEVMDYRSSVSWSLADSKRRILTDVGEASGTIDAAVKRKLVGLRLNSNNEIEYQGMFNPTDPENQASLAMEFTDDMIQGLCAKLALAIPLTADVTGLNRTGTKFGITKGLGNGVFAGTKVVIWMKDPIVGAVALAIAEAEPTIDTAALNIIAWNESDEDAGPVITELKATPSKAAELKLKATTVDIPFKEMLKPRPAQGS